MKIAAVFIELKMNPGHLPVALEPRPSHEAVYHEFMCSEMVPDSARKMSGQPFSLGASPFPPLGMPFSMDPGPPCRVAPPPSGHHHTMPPLPPPPARPTLHVEVCQKQQSNMRASRLKEMVVELLREKRTTFGELVMTEFEDSVLKEHLQSVSITDTPNELKLLDLQSYPLEVHMFRLHEEGPLAEELEDEGGDCASSHWTLPAVEFDGLWESLVYDMDIKQRLLNYVETTLYFSEKGVNPLIISWNRVVLLHGPPGTGKTSLCKALAQKLSIRLSDRYTYGQLVEINTHSLFSKWFSESGKLVQKMFQKLQDMIEDPSTLVCVLIDEVESLTAARKSAVKGSEPSDAIRVVNALLTQLDQIRRYPNVLILTTSNITEAIDIAFIDRADIKQYIGVPSVAAIYKIYHTCIKELTRVGIINPAHQLLDLRTLEVMRFLENDTTRFSLHLRDIARQSEGLSGRSLRKMPFLAHSLLNSSQQGVSLGQFLDVLERAVRNQISDRTELVKTGP